MTLDTPNPYDAELSALVDTWQRRFNLELQRALAAEEKLVHSRVSNAELVKLRDELTLRADAAESELAETRAELARWEQMPSNSRDLVAALHGAQGELRETRAERDDWKRQMLGRVDWYERELGKELRETRAALIAEKQNGEKLSEALRETREALERAEELLRELRRYEESQGYFIPLSLRDAARAFLARLPTEEENL